MEDVLDSAVIKEEGFELKEMGNYYSTDVDGFAERRECEELAFVLCIGFREKVGNNEREYEGLNVFGREQRVFANLRDFFNDETEVISEVGVERIFEEILFQK